MTNIVQALSQSAIPVAAINWTFIISIFTICLTTMATLIKIFSGHVKEEDLRNSKYIKGVDQKTEENFIRIDKIKEEVSDHKNKLSVLTTRTDAHQSSIESLKTDNRELVQRLDDLLRQLLEWVSHFE